MTVGILALASMLIWVIVTQELSKPSENQNNQKIITFTAMGTLSTVILTISLFKDIMSF